MQIPALSSLSSRTRTYSAYARVFPRLRYRCTYRYDQRPFSRRTPSRNAPATSASAPVLLTPTPTTPHRRLFTRTFLGLGVGIGISTALAIYSYSFSSFSSSSSFSPPTTHGDAPQDHRADAESGAAGAGGGGAGGGAGVLLKADVFSPYNFETVVEVEGGAHIESTPSPGIWRRDSFQLGSNFPIEDVIATSEWDFSPTLTWSCITILDGHNGARLADFLARVLSLAVLGAISDVYSAHARLEAENSNAGFDLSGGREVRFSMDGDGVGVGGEGEGDGRNPGDPPDPYPPSDELDAAIREAFVGLDDFIVHEAARTVLGLSKDEYAKLRAGGAWDEDKDKERARMGRAKACEMLAYAYAGSCAIMGLFNPQDRSLRVALTGDLRAVHGRRVPNSHPHPTPSNSNSPTPSHIYIPTPLTQDQNALNPSEARLLTLAHPDEPDLLKKDRVVGWGPSRAFGDGSMKWPLPVQHQLRERYFGDRVREEVRTPPYFTAEPVVTRCDGDGVGGQGGGGGQGVGKEGRLGGVGKMRRGDFVVFASDGLWDCLTSEEVVGLVGWWLEERGTRERVKEEKGKVGRSGRNGREIMLPPVTPKKALEGSYSHEDEDGDESMPSPVKLHVPLPPSPPPSPPTSPSHPSSRTRTLTPPSLPVSYPPTYKDTTTSYKFWRAEKGFVCHDSNIAAHLVRNALGGKDREVRDALTGMDVSRSRRFRDDISVVVVFFD